MSRENAIRAFAREFNDASYTFQESDDDRAPKYALLPSGEKANRVFIVGTLTETRDVGSDEPYIQARVVDQSGGTFFCYAGKYQQEARSTLQSLNSPTYVAVVGKPRTYETDDGEVNVSVQPEFVTEVSQEEREIWERETAARTLDRIESFDVEDELCELAFEKYEPDLDQYISPILEGIGQDLEEEQVGGPTSHPTPAQAD